MAEESQNEVVSLARAALHDLLEGDGLHAALVKSATVAAFRGDVEDRAWFQFQTSDLSSTDKTKIPDDFFRLRRNIDVVTDRAEQRRIFENAKKEYLDSRTMPDDPSTVIHASAERMDEMLRQFDLLERTADGRPIEPPDLVPQMRLVRSVRRRIAERTEAYLRAVIGL
jgi:hypothetical protein